MSLRQEVPQFRVETQGRTKLFSSAKWPIMHHIAQAGCPSMCTVCHFFVCSLLVMKSGAATRVCRQIASWATQPCQDSCSMQTQLRYHALPILRLPVQTNCTRCPGDPLSTGNIGWKSLQQQHSLSGTCFPDGCQHKYPKESTKKKEQRQHQRKVSIPCNESVATPAISTRQSLEPESSCLG